MRTHPYLRCAGRLSLLPLIFFSLRAADAGSATWNLNPSNNSWTTEGNWTPATVPNGIADVATFGVSNTVGISLAAPTSSPLTLTLDSAVFNAGASNFTIEVKKGLSSTQLVFVGAGVVNNSGTYQQFTVTGSQGGIVFSNSADAGFNCDYTVSGSTATDPLAASNITFRDDSSCEFIFLTNLGSASAAPGNQGGQTIFLDSAHGGDSTITNGGAQVVGGVGGFTLFSGVDGTAPSAGATSVGSLGGEVAGAAGGLTIFEGNATLGSGAASVSAGYRAGAFGGTVIFQGNATAGNGFIGGGEFTGSQGLPGHIFFFDDSTGGTADCFIFDGSVLDISQHNPPGLTVGVFAGDGIIYLGSNNLTTGVPTTSSNFDGTIQDGGVAGGVGGSFTCGGSVTITSANTYTGGTVIDGGGFLRVAAPTGSAVGSGPVQILNGTLAGKGTILNTVVVGTGSGPQAWLVPESTGNGTIRIRKKVFFRGDATFFIQVSVPPTATKVVARGVRIESGAVINVSEAGVPRVLPPGTVYTVLENTFSQPIVGAFSNLPDGGTIAAGENTLLANYTGGDGNDLTLTVVP
jgi:fibronectin-binding autotransporter adhesin